MLILMTLIQESMTEEQVVITDHQQENEIFSVLRVKKQGHKICKIDSLEIYKFSNAKIGENVKPQIYKFENQSNDNQGCWTYFKVDIKNKMYNLVVIRNIYNTSTLHLKALDLQNMQHSYNKFIQSCLIKSKNHFIQNQSNELEIYLICNSEINQSRLEKIVLSPFENHKSSQSSYNLSITTYYGIFSSNSNIFCIYQNNSNLILNIINKNQKWLLDEQFQESGIQEFHFQQQNQQILIVSANLNKMFLIQREEIKQIKIKNVQIMQILDLRILQDSRTQVLLKRQDQFEIASIDFKSNKIETWELGPLTGVVLLGKYENQYVQSNQNTSEFLVNQIASKAKQKSKIVTQQEQIISFSELQQQTSRFLQPRMLTGPDPPYFETTPLPTQTIELGGTLNYTLQKAYQNYYSGTGALQSKRLANSTFVSVSYTKTISFITFNSSPYPGSILITPSKNNFALVGNHTIGITLASTQSSTVYSQEYLMNVEVTNSAPTFSSPLQNITLNKGETKLLSLPTTTDLEGHTVTITCTPPQPFIILDNVTNFNIAPTSISDIGNHTVTVTLSDSALNNSYTFQVIVPSRPPAFDDSTTSFPDLTITLNSNDKFPVSTFSDPDGETVNITLEAVSGSVPTWIQLQNSSTLVYAAPDMSTVVGTYNLKLVLTTSHDTVSFPFKVTATNSAPYLIGGLSTSSYSVNINTLQTIDFTSQVMDNETHPVTLNAYYTPSGGTQTLITNTSDIFTQANLTTYIIVISPTSITHLGNYTVQFNLTDTNMQTSYSFQVDLPNRPPLFNGSTPSFPNLTIALNSNDKFTVPAFTDPDGETVTISIQAVNESAPTWVQLQNNNTEVYAAPPLLSFSDVKTHNLELVLSSSQNVSFPFKIIVTNSAPYLEPLPLPSYSTFLNTPQTIDFSSQVKDNETHPVTLIAYYTPSGGTQTLITNTSAIFTQETLTPYIIVISPTKIADIGNYSVSFTLSDSNMNSSYTFQVDVPSRVPTFSGGITSFADLTIAMNSNKSHSIPAFSDPDGEVVTISIQDSTGATFPSWAALKNSNSTMEAAPVAFTDVGTHSLKIVLTTEHDTVSFPFQITVTNTAPYFNNTPETGFQIDITFNKTIDLTGIVEDKENHQIFLSAFYTFKGVNHSIPYGIFSQQPGALQITISPTTFAHLGSYTLYYEIYDGQPLNSTNFSTFTVINYSPDFFTNSTPVDFTMRFNHSYDYILPPYFDPESNPVNVSLFPDPTGLINTFAKIQPGQKVITFKPNQWTQFQNYDVYLNLSDTDQSKVYMFRMTITNTPPRFKIQKPSTQRAQLNRITWYSLPQTIDDEYNPISVIQHLPIPKFVKFENGRYIFSPTDPATDLGEFEVKFELSDTNKASPFSFKLEVYNNPPYFKKPLEDQNVLFQTIAIYTLPDVVEVEGLSYTITTLKQLPDFIKLENNKFQFYPQQKKEIGQHRIKVCLTDSYGASMCKGFIVTVYEPTQKKSYDATKPKADSQMAINAKKQSKLPSQFKVSMYIQTATRDGRIQIKFNSPMTEDIPKLIENIDENSLRVEIRTQENKPVSFNITQKIALNGIIELKLKFSNPAAISNQIQPDIIQVFAQEDKSVTGSKYTIILMKDTAGSKSLPPQISERMKGMAQTFADGKIQISNSTAVNFAFTLGVQYIWNCLDDFSFLTINSIISMPVPGIVQLIQKVLLNFIYLDLLLTDIWLPQVFQTSNQIVQESGGINEYFEQNGFSTKTLIVNLGSSFVYLAVFVGLFIIYFNIYLLQKVIPCLSRVKEQLEGILFWKYTLKLFFSQFPPLLMSSLINMNELKYGTLIDKVPTILGIFLVSCLPAGLIVVFYQINRVKTIENPKLQELILEDTRGNWVGRNWKSLNLLRWTVTLIIMVFLRSRFEIQIIILIPISVLFQIIMSVWRPLQSTGDHWITLFNEVMTSCYLYILMILTDFTGQSVLRDECGQALVLLLGTVVTVNLLRVFYKFGSYIRMKYLQWQARRQALLKLLGQGKTVAINPSVHKRFVQLDMTTMTNHSADLFSRQPFENSVIQEPKDDPVTTSKNVFGKTSIEEEFKVENDQRPYQKQSQQLRTYESLLIEKRIFDNQALDY